MSTQVSICNRALQKIGVGPVVSLDEGTEAARACSRAWGPSLDAELRAHPWSFAVKRAVLAPDAEAPAFGADYQFSLPSDCLRVLPPQTVGLDWVVEGRKILSSADDSLDLRYVHRPANTALFDGAFVEAFACRMAMELAIALSQSDTVWQRVRADYSLAIAEARRAGAFEQQPTDMIDTSWVTVRGT